jgi:hypothetical protein
LVLFNPNRGTVRIWGRTTGAGSPQLWHADVVAGGTSVVFLPAQQARATVTIVADKKFIPSRLGDGQGGAQLTFAVPGSIKRTASMAPMPRPVWHFYAAPRSTHVSLTINNPNDSSATVGITFVHDSKAGVWRVSAPPGESTVNLTAHRRSDASQPLTLSASEDVVPSRTVATATGSVTAFGIPGPRSKH